ncbi:LapA family protein [Paenarthrobacter nitroguajacolicus]|uniref:LapA family protein n=1 Tax=Paenarthrobacter nitroguajacolicus TaxID=211146 RepID=UPI0015BE4FE9|nr:lipopolysaccharide assembly protein LapA domain-containing protein [Paenarthrobacter nitroguajacolicus]NWL34657.1 DUF1049 domain-containing protein [Paenarthrobacter nitroguajacolicus]
MSFQDDAARIPGGSARPDRGSPDRGNSEQRDRAVPPASGHDRPTRTAALWVAVAVGLAVLVMLIVFFVQNQDMITVRFFGLEGTLALGTTLFIAAVGGGVLVALAGGARILQLRMNNHRRKKAAGGPGVAP